METHTEKLSIRSAIFVASSSMIGAGIFLKAPLLRSLSHGQGTPLVFLFLIFLLNLIAFIFILLRVVPRQSGDAGFMDWSRRYCSPWLNALFVNFIRYIYHPLSLVIFSVYVTDGIFGISAIGFRYTILFSIIICLIILCLNLISFRFSHRLQIFLWWIVLIPLLILPLVGFLSSSTPGDLPNENLPKGLDGAGPWMVMLSGLPALLFIYDGFYNLASLRCKLQDPRKLTLCLVSSVILVTIIYLYVIIGFSVGNIDITSGYLAKPTPLRDMFMVLMGCASLLTLNSIALGNVPQLEAMDRIYHFQDLRYLRRIIFYKRVEDNLGFGHRLINWIYLTIQTLLAFVALGIVSEVVNVSSNLGIIDVVNALADIITVFVFLILASIILGSLRTPMHGARDKFFRACAYVSGGLILLALGYMLISNLAGAGGIAGADPSPHALRLSLLILLSLATCAPAIYSRLDLRLNRRSHLLYPVKYDNLSGAKNV